MQDADLYNRPLGTRDGFTSLPHTRGSALIGWVKDDAEFIAERIAAYQGSTVPPSPRQPVGAAETAAARSTERM